MTDWHTHARQVRLTTGQWLTLTGRPRVAIPWWALALGAIISGAIYTAAILGILAWWAAV